jgi:hypothetical protein
MMLDSDVSVGVVTDHDGRVLGLLTYDKIAAALR